MTEINSEYHIPVMLNESIDPLVENNDGVYVDVTFGGGSHSREILSRLSKKGHLLSFDQDQDAIENAPDDKRHTMIHNNFMFLRGCVRAAGFDNVDGILADLGVSSHHFDTPERGFSFRFDGPLDMRMNQEAILSASDVVNTYSLEQLTKIIAVYGELDKPMRLASDLLYHRENAPIETIQQLKDAVRRSTPRTGDSKFYAKLFQALRIEVNQEMRALEMMLQGALKLLKPGGILSVITYHSLEDRLVKNFMRSGNFEGKVEKDFFGKSLAPFELVNRKPIDPSQEEVEINPRSRSAKLRVARKL